MKKVLERIWNFKQSTHIAPQTFLEIYMSPITKNLDFGELKSVPWPISPAVMLSQELFSWVNVLGDFYKKRVRTIIMEPGEEHTLNKWKLSSYS